MINKNKKPVEKKNINILQYCKKLIFNLHRLNKKIKHECYTTDVDGYVTVDKNELYNEGYNFKNKQILKIIQIIRKYNLNIKYGKKENVIYFSYNGKQISFHNFNDISKIKNYKGNWQGTAETKNAYLKYARA